MVTESVRAKWHTPLTRMHTSVPSGWMSISACGPGVDSSGRSGTSPSRATAPTATCRGSSPNMRISARWAAMRSRGTTAACMRSSPLTVSIGWWSTIDSAMSKGTLPSSSKGNSSSSFLAALDGKDALRMETSSPLSSVMTLSGGWPRLPSTPRMARRVAAWCASSGPPAASVTVMPPSPASGGGASSMGCW